MFRAASPLAARHFAVPGVTGVFFGYDFITVTKENADWQHLKPAILGSIMEHFMSGQPIMAEENIDETIRIDPDLFHPRADFLHRVSGHSMKDVGILDGDLVGIHYQPDADNGQIIAAALYDRRSGREAITLKRYFRRGNKIRLESENSDPKYKTIEIDLAQQDEDSQEDAQFRIAGLYAGLIRRPR